MIRLRYICGLCGLESRYWDVMRNHIWLRHSDRLERENGWGRLRIKVDDGFETQIIRGCRRYPCEKICLETDIICSFEYFPTYQKWKERRLDG